MLKWKAEKIQTDSVKNYSAMIQAENTKWIMEICRDNLGCQGIFCAYFVQNIKRRTVVVNTYTDILTCYWWIAYKLGAAYLSNVILTY